MAQRHYKWRDTSFIESPGCCCSPLPGHKQTSHPLDWPSILVRLILDTLHSCFNRIIISLHTAHTSVHTSHTSVLTLSWCVSWIVGELVSRGLPTVSVKLVKRSVAVSVATNWSAGLVGETERGWANWEYLQFYGLLEYQTRLRITTRVVDFWKVIGDLNWLKDLEWSRGNNLTVIWKLLGVINVHLLIYYLILWL